MSFALNRVWRFGAKLSIQPCFLTAQYLSKSPLTQTMTQTAKERKNRIKTKTAHLAERSSAECAVSHDRSGYRENISTSDEFWKACTMVSMKTGKTVKAFREEMQQNEAA